MGSSLGGYLSLLMLRDSKFLQDYLSGIVLMCPAIDFPLFKLEDLTDEEYGEFKQRGKFDLDLSREYRKDDPSLEPIWMYLSKEMIDDARELAIIVGEKIDFDCEMKIMWGRQDKTVPPERMNLLVEKLTDNALTKTQVFWQEKGDHSLGSRDDLLKIEFILGKNFGLI